MGRAFHDSVVSKEHPDPDMDPRIQEMMDGVEHANWELWNAIDDSDVERGNDNNEASLFRAS